MTTVEQAMAEAPHHMTAIEISEMTGRHINDVRTTLQSMAANDQIDLIPARGTMQARYAIKSISSGAMPEPQPALGQKAGSDGLGNASSPEAVAVATENPEPDAASSLQSEGSGRDVLTTADVIGEIVVALDGVLPPNQSVVIAEASGFIVISAKRRPLRFAKIENASSAAKSAIRAGAKRAEVFALVRVGVAKKGAEWSET